MPNETRNAVDWALKQSEERDGFVSYTKDKNGIIDRQMLVDFVSQYFNDNNIKYSTFDFNDLKPYL